MKIEQVIHHDLAYVIQKGMAGTALPQGLTFTPSNATFTLPGNAYLIISVKENKLRYQLQFLETEKE